MRMKPRFALLLGPLAAFLLLSWMLYLEAMGIGYSAAASEPVYLPETVAGVKAAEPTQTCLLLYNGKEDGSDTVEEIEATLSQMSVGFTALDITESPLPGLDAYRTVVAAVMDFSPLGDQLITLTDWVYGGGDMLFALCPEPTMNMLAVKGRMGISSSNVNYMEGDSFTVVSNLLPGAEGMTFQGPDFGFYSLAVGLTADCVVHIRTASEPSHAILWHRDYGQGRFVVSNSTLFDSHKTTRGVIAACYSLLGDVCAWPVVNASIMYIDDFPAPIPEGTSPYITADYDYTIETFFTNIWWPNMLTVAKEHNLVYTGLLLETYNDWTTRSLVNDSIAREERFQYFGNQLLAAGGGIGAHGYNHQPLCPDGFDYSTTELDYNTFPSVDKMAEGFAELLRFGEECFPGTTLTTYVPPSNILSEEGREMIAKRFPNIKSISAVYLADKESRGFEQEFDVSPDGIINVPRISSGMYLDDFGRWSIINALSLHYVNSHFLHPDDVLDPERGAEYGWPQLYQWFGEYLDWLMDSAPGLRNLTGDQAAAAVQRYDALTVTTTAEDNAYRLTLSGFYDEAYLLLRLNHGTPEKAEGGSLTLVEGNLYLVKADSPVVVITMEE